MPKTRLYLPNRLQAGQIVPLDHDQAHYLGRVLRLRVGDTIGVFDGQGTECAAEVLSIERRRATVRLHDALSIEPEPRVAIRLLQGIPRGERMDFTLQKCTELGAAAFVPVMTARSVVRLDSARADKRQSHWQRITASACEQCGRRWVPTISEPITFDSVVTQLPPQDTRLLLTQTADAALATITIDTADGIDLLVGPEGGFETEELDLAINAGFQPVSIGPRVLRSETAGIAALAILQARYGDLRGTLTDAPGRE